MNEATSQNPCRTRVLDFIATVWPISSPTDSDLQRRTKNAVRAGQLAMVIMVWSAVIGTIIADAHQLSIGNIAGMVALTIILLQRVCATVAPRLVNYRYDNEIKT